MEIFQTKIVIKNRSFMVETSRLRHRNRKTRKPVFISQIWTTINLTCCSGQLKYFPDIFLPLQSSLQTDVI